MIARSDRKFAMANDVKLLGNIIQMQHLNYMNYKSLYPKGANAPKTKNIMVIIIWVISIKMQQKCDMGGQISKGSYTKVFHLFLITELQILRNINGYEEKKQDCVFNFVF